MQGLTLDRPAARQLSQELRQGRGGTLPQRRAVAALSLVAAGSMGVIALYQLGLIRHLPEPPLPKLDADEVDAAEDAYALLAAPDAVLGLGSYAATLALASFAGEDRARTHPWLAYALAGKTLFDAAQAAKLTRDQAVKHEAYCFWCLLAAGATFASVPFALAEAREAWRQSRRAPRPRPRRRARRNDDDVSARPEPATSIPAGQPV